MKRRWAATRPTGDEENLEYIVGVAKVTFFFAATPLVSPRNLASQSLQP